MNTEHFIKKEVELKDPTTGASVKRIASGIVEYPYSFELPGDISESIEGLIGQFVEYNLKAYADRPLLAAKLEAKRHLRIVRTLGETNQSELLDRQEVRRHFLPVLVDSVRLSVVPERQVGQVWRDF